MAKDAEPDSCDKVDATTETNTSLSVVDKHVDVLELTEIYRIALQFFREKEGKDFMPSYQQRVDLMALSRLVAQLNRKTDSKEGSNFDVGYFDFFGNDVRSKLSSEEFEGLSAEQAKTRFVSLLNEICFAGQLDAILIEKAEAARAQRAEAACVLDAVAQMKTDPVEITRDSGVVKPGTVQRLASPNMQKDSSPSNNDLEAEARRLLDEHMRRNDVQKKQIQDALNAQTLPQFQAYAAQQYPNDCEQQEQLIRQLQDQHYVQYMQQVFAQHVYLQQQSTPGNQSAKCTAVEPAVNGVTTSPSVPSSSGNTPAKVEKATTWIRKEIAQFKEAIKHEGSEGILNVGNGETVTVRVPTHDDGSQLFWEFASDDYDLGFGLQFEWPSETAVAAPVVTMDENDEPEADSSATSPRVDSILETDRRNCNEVVHAGSHVYPGKGVYLLRFDNSFSLWRSKSLYYRVYYSR